MQLSLRGKAVKESSTLAITAKAKEMKAAGHNIISFSVGEPDFDTPPHIVDAAIDALKSGFTKYTASSGIPALRQAICDKLLKDNGLTYKPGHIVVSNGAKHALQNAFAAILNDGDEVIIPAPFWLTYPESVSLAGGTPVILNTGKNTGYKVTAAQIEAAVTNKTKAVIINSPNNPSGAVYTKDELSAIADTVCKHDLIAVSDEIYEKLIYDADAPHISIASFGADIFARTIVINGLSKSHAMTGWRMGYTASSPEIASVISNIQSHQASNINSMTQMAAIAAINGDQTCLLNMRNEFHKRRDYIVSRAGLIKGLEIGRPQGAFYLFAGIESLAGKGKGITVNNAADFAAALLDQTGVAIVPCADFGCDMHIRLSFAASMDDIKEGMDRLERFVNDNFN